MLACLRVRACVRPHMRVCVHICVRARGADSDSGHLGPQRAKDDAEAARRAPLQLFLLRTLLLRRLGVEHGQFAPALATTQRPGCSTRRLRGLRHAHVVDAAHGWRRVRRAVAAVHVTRTTQRLGRGGWGRGRRHRAVGRLVTQAAVVVRKKEEPPVNARRAGELHEGE